MQKLKLLIDSMFVVDWIGFIPLSGSMNLCNCSNLTESFVVIIGLERHPKEISTETGEGGRGKGGPTVDKEEDELEEESCVGDDDEGNAEEVEEKEESVKKRKRSADERNTEDEPEITEHLVSSTNHSDRSIGQSLFRCLSLPLSVCLSIPISSSAHVCLSITQSLFPIVSSVYVSVSVSRLTPISSSVYVCLPQSVTQSLFPISSSVSVYVSKSVNIYLCLCVCLCFCVSVCQSMHSYMVEILYRIP